MNGQGVTDNPDSQQQTGGMFMNRNDRELHNDWEESWERPEQNQGNGLTAAQVLLIILAVLLLAALIAILVLFFS